ncbi:MAG: division/cell wall cluster transcriptional repressor MraZ [Bacteroidota bacterium]
MITFIGDYPCKIDVKGRITLPVAFIKQMESSLQMSFVIKKDIFVNCLLLYPMNEWERQIKLLRSRLNPYNKEHNRFLREFSKGMAEVNLDSSKRLLIPKRLLDYAEISKEIILAGQDSKIEIWDATKYAEIGENQDEIGTLAEKILGNNFYENPE